MSKKMDLEDEGWVNIPYDKVLEGYDDIEDKPMFEKQFDDKEEIKEVIEQPILIKDPKETSFEPRTNDQDPIFQVFLKKDHQFVEMKPGFSQLNLRESDEKNEDLVMNCSSKTASKSSEEEVVSWKESNQRLNLWKVGFNGIGVFCSLGMAAVTICIVMCGNGRRQKQQNYNLKFQIYPENKRIKQVVERANEAMSAVRGVPLVNAQITYGGYHESL